MIFYFKFNEKSIINFLLQDVFEIRYAHLPDELPLQHDGLLMSDSMEPVKSPPAYGNIPSSSHSSEASSDNEDNEELRERRLRELQEQVESTLPSNL